MTQRTGFVLCAVLALQALVVCNSVEAQAITSVTRGGSSGNAAPAIAPAGLTNGAACFVDRTHAYANVPASLQDIEYVQTANDDKTVADYSLNVTVSTAGTLYLFIDNRVGDNNTATAPDLGAVMTWVTADGLTATGEVVDIDESANGSVDNTFTVYSMDVAAGSHVLGAQDDSGGRNMYGVAFDGNGGGPPDGERFTPIQLGSTWRYFKGTQEASNPVGAWRTIGFDDAAWDSGDAPFGYGEARPVGTNLSDMQNSYSTYFLRQTFNLDDPSVVREFSINVDYDDGFMMWINGTEVARINVNGLDGDLVSFNGLSTSGHESGLLEPFSLPDPSAYLLKGANVVAVMVFNTSLTSSDSWLDLELFDPFAPDITAPSMSLLAPAGGTTIRSLTQIQVDFDEDVTGIDAADLIVDGSPATGIAGDGPYTFTFPEVAPGTITVEWAADTGITDLADVPNAFAGGSWTYTIDPDAPLGNLILNELLAANRSGITDEDGEEEDWFEVYNAGGVAVDVTGWSATDDPDEPGKWVFPSRSIGPGEYFIVFASGKDRAPANGNVHTSFSLTTGGEYVGIFNGESPRQVVSEISPRFPRQRADYSYGLDGTGTLTYFENPTPGAANVGGVTFDGFVLDPIVTPGRSFQDSPFDVTISTVDPLASVRYTLDGSDPSPTSGTPYTGPINISPSANRGLVPLRAIAYRDGFLPSDIATHSYLFVESVMTQTDAQPGYPGTLVNSFDADYEMDDSVVNDPAHTELVRQGLTAIPTLSLVSEPNNFFGTSGNMYNPATADSQGWEIPVSAELINPDGTPGFQIDCAHRIQGGSSTGGWKSHKVSQRLLFKGDYGPTKLRYPLFPSTHVDEFDQITLDAHLNQTWNHPSHGQRVRAVYNRDTYSSDLQNAMGGHAPHDQFMHLYINGIYWGMYDVHEKPEATWAASNFGGSKFEYDAIKHEGSNVVDGNGQAWASMRTLALRDQSVLANYEAVIEVLDPVDLADYMLLNIFTGNDDWPRHNWFVTRRRVPGGVWRFHSWDAEHCLKDGGRNNVNVNDGNSPAEIFQSLRNSPEFRLLVADRVHKHWFNGGAMYVDPSNTAWDPNNPERNRPAQIWMDRVNNDIDPAIACESARWGDTKRGGNPYTRNSEWQSELNWVLTYFRTRSATVFNQLRSGNLYPATGAPIYNQHGGQIELGFLLTMARPSGTNGTIYYTLDGTDPRVFGTGDVSGIASTYSGAVTLEGATQVKARVRNGTTWSALSEAVFTLSEPSQSLRFSEIMYNPIGGILYEFIEIQNVGDTAVDLFGLSFTNGIFTFPLDTTIPAGDYFVIAADAASFVSRYPDAPLGAIFDGNLANGGEKIAVTDSEGNEVISMTYDEDGLWPIGADILGYSIVVADPDGDPNDPENWVSSRDIHGSPGASDGGPLHGRVVINEVLARGSNPFEDAIELHNITASAVDVGGWYLSDSRIDSASLKKYRIPDGTVIAGGGYASIYEADFSGAFQLSDLQGAVYLAAADAGDNLTGYVVEAEYGPQDEGVSFGRHATSTGVDFTSLADKTFGIDTPASVPEFRTGTGDPNSSPQFGPLVINELMYNPSANREEFIELYNPTGSPISLHDAGSGMGWRLSGILNAFETDVFEFGEGAEVPAQSYLLVVGIDPDLFRTLNAVPAEVPVIGPYGGRLDNGGENVRLSRPNASTGLYVVTDNVDFDDELPWPLNADGEGYSLERISSESYGNDAVNWDASVRNDGTPGAQNSVDGSGGNRDPQAVFTASPSGGEAPLEVLFNAGQSYDLDGEIVSYDWDFDDGTTDSGPIAIHTFDEGLYFVRLTVQDDEGAESTSTLILNVGADPGGRQVPGDCNQDGLLDISDGLCLLYGLVDGPPANPPCGDPGSGFAGTLLDFDGENGVNLTDVVGMLNYLFLNGPTHDLGENCLQVPGCVEVCAE